VRPSSSYTSSLKVQQLASFKYADQNPRDHEEDHRVPLELGGAPSFVANLSPERGTSPNSKDTAENAARSAVCGGRLTLRQAQVPVHRDMARGISEVPAMSLTSTPFIHQTLRRESLPEETALEMASVSGSAKMCRILMPPPTCSKR
jgi:hypothetical protein